MTISKKSLELMNKRMVLLSKLYNDIGYLNIKLIMNITGITEKSTARNYMDLIQKSCGGTFLYSNSFPNLLINNEKCSNLIYRSLLKYFTDEGISIELYEKLSSSERIILNNSKSHYGVVKKPLATPLPLEC